MLPQWFRTCQRLGETTKTGKVYKCEVHGWRKGEVNVLSLASTIPPPLSAGVRPIDIRLLPLSVQASAHSYLFRVRDTGQRDTASDGWRRKRQWKRNTGEPWTPGWHHWSFLCELFEFPHPRAFSSVLSLENTILYPRKGCVGFSFILSSTPPTHPL